MAAAAAAAEAALGSGGEWKKRGRKEGRKEGRKAREIRFPRSFSSLSPLWFPSFLPPLHRKRRGLEILCAVLATWETCYGNRNTYVVQLWYFFHS